jgi:hypothetical protein
MLRRFPGLIVDVIALKRSSYYEVRATHDRIPDYMNGVIFTITIEKLIADVKQTCPHLIDAKVIAATSTPTRPAPAGIQFRFPL